MNPNNVEIDNLHLIIREPVERSSAVDSPKRQYWGVAKSWVNDIREARLYKDREIALTVRRDLTRGCKHFFVKGHFSVPTRFAVLSESEARIQHDAPNGVIPKSIGLQGTYYQEKIPRRF